MPDESRSKDVEGPKKSERRKRKPEGPKGEPDVTAYPTAILISRRSQVP